MNPIPLTSLVSPAIHLWLVDLGAGLDNAMRTPQLDANELAKAARFRFERDARRYRISHQALRSVLGDHVGRPAAALAFTEGAFGKPRLVGAGMPHFNMSHSGDWALIGVCDAVPIGVDIEVMQPMDDLQALARRNFSAREFAAFEATASTTQLDAFLRCWTRKEACLKALGSGLSIEPHVFEAGLGTESMSTFIDVDGRPCRMKVEHIDLPIAAKAACAHLLAQDGDLAM
ncbi:4'-phosphopantetheinyl transferase family protein [Hydrogenophaga sp. BPS33]|uniref:4'-phosphopantetheinyl transferase family protein n=1 Tax=Hydrogenophaga sp. BPS33 TaxID=2651974 RepID=UPI00132017CB|nr:4'-phosphopantetheinyl transferase superfamily protein [Hydrogenophaga sp. BPS33]QHE85930.1 4'-phosphopantetheinyl transferase superfamily protein [Hydrogenophaga sp. BPS33]